MSTIAITSLPIVTTSAVGDVFPLVQNGTTSQITNADLFNSVTDLTVANPALIDGVTISGSTGTSSYVFGSASNLALNVSGTNSFALGTDVLSSNTSGSLNIGIGSLALNKNETGSSNVAIGYVAQRLRTTGSFNLALGDNALASDLTSSFNTAVGAVALLNSTTGSNTAVGYRSGYLITTGTKNTILGRYTGNQGGLDIRTLSNYIVLSDGDGNPRAYWNGADATFGGLIGTSAAAATIASATTIAPTKSITFISGTAAVVTITAATSFAAAGGSITLIPTAAFTWTTAGNIAVAGTAVVSRALTMTYDSGTTKWYPSYV